MKTIRLFILVAVLVVCNTASAQFSNANTSHKQRSSMSSGENGFDGNGPQVGLKGYVEGGYTLGLDGNDSRFGVQGSFGYQFNQYIFAGAGAGVNFFSDGGAFGDEEFDDRQMAIPIFADFRVTFLNHSISPYVSTKVGYSVDGVTGLFFSPSVGCRIGFGNNKAFVVSLGYEIQQATYKYREVYWDDYYQEMTRSGFVTEKTKSYSGLAFKVGYEF